MRAFVCLFGLLATSNVTAVEPQAVWYVGVEGYRYAEPGVMSERSRLPALSLGIRAEPQGDPTRNTSKLGLAVELGYGPTKYQGSGTLDTSFSRMTVEISIPLSNQVSVGAGYRTLTDHLAGKISSTGQAGYDRVSEYVYLPITKTIATTRGDLTVRYIHLVNGLQKSRLSRIQGFSADLKNRQKFGYGLGASYRPTLSSWEVFWRYWNIGVSDRKKIFNETWSIYGVGWEPKNRTSELGVRFYFD